jgi:hypothetical protein
MSAMGQFVFHVKLGYIVKMLQKMDATLRHRGDSTTILLIFANRSVIPARFAFSAQLNTYYAKHTVRKQLIWRHRNAGPRLGSAIPQAMFNQQYDTAFNY